MQIPIVISSLFYIYFFINIIMISQFQEKRPELKQRSTVYELYLVIPVLNEANVIENTINNLRVELETLPATIHGHIIAIDDASSDQSLAILKSINCSYLHVIHRSKKIGRKGKGQVLNTATTYIKNLQESQHGSQEKTIIGVLDADAVISGTDLAYIINYFKNYLQIDMIQTAVTMYNKTNWLTTMQDFEFMCINNSTQQLRNQLGQGIASGNGQFVRLSLVLKNHWGNSLLEDLEFTIRAWLAGKRTVYTHYAVVQQEAVNKLKPLIRQRIRWCQGGLQCLKYLPSLWHTPNINFFQRIDTTLWLATPLLACLVSITNVTTLSIQTAYILKQWHSDWSSPALGVIVALNIGTCLFLAIVYQRNYAVVIEIPSFLKALLLSISFQIYLIILSVVPFVAVSRQLSGKSNWEKTSHANLNENKKVKGRS